MSRVAVSEPILRWALERSGRLTAVKRKFPKLGEWERGESYPTLRQLESLSKATSTPLGYFFLSEPPEERVATARLLCRGFVKASERAHGTETVRYFCCAALASPRILAVWIRPFALPPTAKSCSKSS